MLNRPLILLAVLLLYATMPAVAHLFSGGDQRRSLAALIVTYLLGAAYLTNVFHSLIGGKEFYPAARILGKALSKEPEYERTEESKCLDTRLRHDLRNSVNVIMGFADLLSTETAGTLNKKQQIYVHNIGAGARQMLALVDSKSDASGNEERSNSSGSDKTAQV